jgi:hypothetical protein
MKIRILANSVRFRLSQTEVTALVHTGETWSKCQFPVGELVYGIVETDADEISCTFNNGRVTAKVPKTLLANWDLDFCVGFEHSDDILYILIEKDWQCLKPRENENESNLYVNPAAL